MTLSPRRTIFAIAVFGAAPLLVACPKKPDPVVDAAPPPPVPEAAPPILLPMEDDAGADADADADAGKKLTGTAVNTNVARLKQCCSALAAQGKQLGSSPEGGFFTSAAAQCSVMAAQAGPTGTAPELGVIRQVLVGKTIPAVCAGF